FMRVTQWRAIAAIGGAAASAALVTAPIVAGYLRIHGDYSVARDFDEVLKYSGDLTSLVTASPLSSLWAWTSGWNGGERQLFPGLTVVAMIAGGVIWRPWRTANPAPPWRAVAAGCWALAALLAAAALWAELAGPTVWQQGWLRVSIRTPYKPLTLSLLFAATGLLSTERVRRAWQRRSPFAFYVIAAVALYACSLGPRPTLAGRQILYEPPYAWLMRLPFFDETVRVPARFAMLGMLAVAVAASLAFARLSHPRWRAVAFTIAAAGILGDSWMRDLPLPQVSGQVFQIPPDDRSAAVIEVPLGGVWRDSAALYRATLHQARTVNGYNGFEPSYYQVLRRALEDHDPTILSALAAAGPLLIAADKQADPEQSLRAFLARQDGVRHISDGARWTLFRLARQVPPPLMPICEGAALAIAGAADRRGPIDTSALTDGNPHTRWITSAPQRVNDAMILDLGRADTICSVELSMGREAAYYPGALVISVSPDGTQWSEAFHGRLGGATFRAALDDPSNVRITLPMPATPVRFLRLRIEQSQPVYPWAVAEVVITEATGG
ncbi:MAG: discoidin domain-containing protein, partial [Vicinamibacterales bacterium]